MFGFGNVVYRVWFYSYSLLADWLGGSVVAIEGVFGLLLVIQTLMITGFIYILYIYAAIGSMDEPQGSLEHLIPCNSFCNARGLTKSRYSVMIQ